MTEDKNKMDTIETLIVAAIPSIIAALSVWMLQKKITKAESERQKREEKQEALQMIILDSVNGAIALSEATARAVQRIPDAHCNGDMHAALDDIEDAMKTQKRMLIKAGVHDIMHED